MKTIQLQLPTPIYNTILYGLENKYTGGFLQDV